MVDAHGVDEFVGPTLACEPFPKRHANLLTREFGGYLRAVFRPLPILASPERPTAPRSPATSVNTPLEHSVEFDYVGDQPFCPGDNLQFPCASHDHCSVTACSDQIVHVVRTTACRSILPMLGPAGIIGIGTLANRSSEPANRFQGAHTHSTAICGFQNNRTKRKGMMFSL